MSVLSDGKDGAIALPARLLVVMLIVAMLLTIVIFVTFRVREIMPARCEHLLKKMMDAMRRRNNYKEQETYSSAQMEAAPGTRKLLSRPHRGLSYSDILKSASTEERPAWFII